MKKLTPKEPKASEIREMRAEYDFAGGVHGKRAAQYAQGPNVIILDPDVARAFPDSEAVSKALRALLPTVARGKHSSRRDKRSAKSCADPLSATRANAGPNRILVARQSLWKVTHRLRRVQWNDDLWKDVLIRPDVLPLLQLKTVDSSLLTE